VKYLWAPWRVEYIKKATEEKGCILCQKPAQNDDVANYILCRGENNFAMLNAYPYNSGHLMIAPYRHVADLGELFMAELHEHFEMVSRGTAVLKQVFQPAGFNIGMNLGRVAGAGIDKHLHSHVVPRWAGDTNFMPVIGGIRVINEALAETYKVLAGKF
jgi:ATP adenylyltransferase